MGSAPEPQAEVLEHEFRAMSTDIHVIVVGGRPIHLSMAEAAVRDREARWSRFLPDSELSILNANPGRPVVVSADTFELITQAVEANRLTAGDFDPTVLSSLVAAGYDRSIEQVRDTLTRRPATHRPAPSPAGIELHEVANAIVLPPGVGLDLGGIAKGAAADAIAGELTAAGAAGCCINIGGDLRALGQAPQQAGWLVELECPGSDETRAIALTEGAVCTSTTVKRRWRAADGTEEHHLRRPETGGPFRNGIRSVTIIGARATQAEVLTKVAFAAGAGPADAARRLTDLGVTGLFVLDDGSIIELDGFDGFEADPVPGAERAA